MVYGDGADDSSVAAYALAYRVTGLDQLVVPWALY